MKPYKYTQKFKRTLSVVGSKIEKKSHQPGSLMFLIGGFLALALLSAGCVPNIRQQEPASISETGDTVPATQEKVQSRMSPVPLTGSEVRVTEEEEESTSEVGQWERYEIVLTSSKNYSNPFTDVEVYADFSSQGQQVRVYGFYDGNGQGGQGNLWKIRFMSGEMGTWTWETGSTDSSNSGLNNQSGIVRVVASNQPGTLQPDPDYPNAWVHANGEHFYWNLGYSIHMLGADRTHPGVGGWQDFLDRLEEMDFNGVMFTLQVPSFRACSTCRKGMAPWNAIGNNPAPKYAVNLRDEVDYFVMPWASKNDPNSTAQNDSSVDYSRFYLPLWQKLDEVLAEMQTKGMLAHIFFYDDQTFWPPASSPEERLYWNYILRRTGAYWNVAYNDGIDLNEFRNLRTWVPEWQNYFQDNDVFNHPRSSRHGDDDMRVSTWRSVQAANSVRPNSIENWRILMRTGPRKPVTEDDGIRARKDDGISPERFMQLAWWSVLSGPGGFGATWAGAYAPGNWYSNMDQDNEDMLLVSIRNKFILGEGLGDKEKVPFWKLEVSDNLVSGENIYCSSVQGEHYLVYFDINSPNSTEIDLSEVSSPLVVTWLNPVSGEYTRAGTWEPGMSTTFRKPFQGPAVLYLSISGTEGDDPEARNKYYIPVIISYPYPVPRGDSYNLPDLKGSLPDK